MDKERQFSELLQQVIEKRRLKRETQENQAAALTLLPAFREKLAGIISTKVFFPSLKGYQCEIGFNNRDSARTEEKPITFYLIGPTALTCLIPSPENDIQVDLSSSAYPIESEGKEDTPRRALDKLEYKVDLLDLDYVLVLKNRGWVIESKTQESDMPRHNFVIGKKYNVRPKWKRIVELKDACLFDKLLDDIESPGTIFKPHPHELADRYL